MGVAFTIDDDLHARLARAAADINLPAETALHDAVIAYVDRLERHGSFHAEALQALAAYRADGLRLSGDELDEWLDGWEPGRPAPACHS